MSDTDSPSDRIDPILEDWGLLPNEPCRFCHRIGGVRFQIDESPWGLANPQVMTCGNCGSTWTADSATA